MARGFPERTGLHVFRKCAKQLDMTRHVASLAGTFPSAVPKGREKAQAQGRLTAEPKKAKMPVTVRPRIVIRPPDRSASTDRWLGGLSFLLSQIRSDRVASRLFGYICISSVDSGGLVGCTTMISLLDNPLLYLRPQEQPPPSDSERGGHGQAQTQPVASRML